MYSPWEEIIPATSESVSRTWIYRHINQHQHSSLIWGPTPELWEGSMQQTPTTCLQVVCPHTREAPQELPFCHNALSLQNTYHQKVPWTSYIHSTLGRWERQQPFHLSKLYLVIHRLGWETKLWHFDALHMSSSLFLNMYNPTNTIL
jgi:hypothetical protein